MGKVTYTLSIIGLALGVALFATVVIVGFLRLVLPVAWFA